MILCPRCAVPCDDGHRFCFACGGELTPPEAGDDPLIGRTLPGGYRVTHLVGVGGMGRVYCAEQVALGRTVAVKVVHPSLADEEQTAARFLNEARAASRLSHPNSVAIFDFGRTDEGRPYIVMEYLRGRDLSRVAADEGSLPLARLVNVLKQTLAALEEAHALGIVHRDLKPDNIVLEPLRSGLDFVKVVDFGLAKILQSDASSRGPNGGGALTRPGLVCGTPEYMSPEQSRGDTLDGRSDLYSVGIVLFEMLAGRVPFVADTATKTLILHLTEAPADARDVAPDRAIPAVFAELAARSLAKEPGERFQSARELSDALERALLESEGRPSFEPAAPTTAVRCRACGASSPMGQKFCGDCGASILSKAPPVSSRRPPPLAREETFASTLWPSDATSIAPALPLLAREDAMTWLESRYHEAGAVLAVARIVGDDGMGKTRLVRELLARCSVRGDFVALVAPDSRARIGDAALRTAIRALTAIPDGAVDPSVWDAAYPDARMGLSLIFGADGDPPSGPGRRRALAEALRWAIETAAERARTGPVVLAVDDFDLIDGTSKNAFEDVLAEPPLVSALIVLTHGPGATAMAGAFPVETWTLAPLPYELFGSRVAQRVAAHGVALAPLHIEQLIAWARETTDPPPERLVDVIARRVERLVPDARQVLQALAVWGDEAPPDALWRMVPAGVDVGAALDALDRARFVSIDERGIRIAHPLVRRVVFSSVPAGRKQELFAKAASIRPDAPLELRAKQAMHGGSSFEALSLLDALSARRAAHGDLAGSVRSLRHALEVARRELHRGEIDDPVGAVLIFSRKLAEALADQEHFADAEGVLREALGTAPPASPHRAHLLGVLARVADARRQPEEARRYLEEAMRVARQSDAGALIPILERLDKRIAVA